MSKKGAGELTQVLRAQARGDVLRALKVQPQEEGGAPLVSGAGRISLGAVEC